MNLSLEGDVRDEVVDLDVFRYAHVLVALNMCRVEVILLVFGRLVLR
jgi:hypothetical protein